MTSYNNGKDSHPKGKHAHSTEYRRLIWEMIVWPLIIETNRPYFSIDEYQSKRVLFSKESNIPSSKLSGGLISLVVKGILIKEEHIYSGIFNCYIAFYSLSLFEHSYNSLFNSLKLSVKIFI